MNELRASHIKKANLLIESIQIRHGQPARAAIYGTYTLKELKFEHKEEVNQGKDVALFIQKLLGAVTIYTVSTAITDSNKDTQSLAFIQAAGCSVLFLFSLLLYCYTKL